MKKINIELIKQLYVIEEFELKKEGVL